MASNAQLGVDIRLSLAVSFTYQSVYEYCLHAVAERTVVQLIRHGSLSTGHQRCRRPSIALCRIPFASMQSMEADPAAGPSALKLRAGAN